MMLMQKNLRRLLSFLMAILIAAAMTGCKLPPEPEQTATPAVTSTPETDVQPTAEPAPEATPSRRERIRTLYGVGSPRCSSALCPTAGGRCTKRSEIRPRLISTHPRSL